MPGRSVLLAESANVSAVPRTNNVTRTTAMPTVPLTIVATRTTSATARPRLATMTMRRRLKRSAAAPPRTPNSRIGRYSLRTASDTRNGSLVRDATSSGPAASTTPSPTLLTIVADRSQRKLRPSLVGTTVSIGRASRERTGGRIATRRAVLSRLPAPRQRREPGVAVERAWARARAPRRVARRSAGSRRSGSRGCPPLPTGRAAGAGGSGRARPASPHRPSTGRSPRTGRGPGRRAGRASPARRVRLTTASRARGPRAARRPTSRRDRAPSSARVGSAAGSRPRTWPVRRSRSRSW